MSKWNEIEQLLTASAPLDVLARENIARDLAGELGAAAIFPQSLSRIRGGSGVVALAEGALRRIAWIGTGSNQPRLVNKPPLAEFKRGPLTITLHDVDAEIMTRLVADIPWLRPRPNPGLPSLGLGDVFGKATPGHIRGICGSGLFPILAQRSVRQNERTGGTFASAMQDVVWGILRDGYEMGFGADADHISLPDEVEEAAKAGYVRFTFALAGAMPDVEGLDRKELARQFAQTEQRFGAAAPWRKKYLGRSFQVPVGLRREGISFDERAFFVTAIRLAPMITSLVELAEVLRHAASGRPYEIEVSLDEADEPTSPHEHMMLATELGDLGVPLAALAPRLPEELIEGLPYEGNLSKVVRRLQLHHGIARATSQHAISLHAAGNKWRLLNRLGDATDGLFHAKIAAPSLNEALRLALDEDPRLFDTIVKVAKDGYTPHGYKGWNLDPSLLPAPSELSKADAHEIFFESREGLLLLRASLGPMMANKECRRGLMRLLEQNEELYLKMVTKQAMEHVKALMGG